MWILRNMITTNQLLLKINLNREVSVAKPGAGTGVREVITSLCPCNRATHSPDAFHSLFHTNLNVRIRIHNKINYINKTYKPYRKLNPEGQAEVPSIVVI